MKLAYLLCCVVLCLSTLPVWSKPSIEERLLHQLQQMLDIQDKRNEVTCGPGSQLTESQGQEILDEHIKYRKAEASSNMNQVTYSDELASRAQENSDLCFWEHDLLTDCSGSGVGQNMYMVGGGSSPPSSISASSLLHEWAAKERLDYDYKSHACSGVCGHYTQVVWAKTSEVGCGITLCSEVRGNVKDENGIKSIQVIGKNMALMTCDYRPAGNYLGVKPYLEGSACSACAANDWESSYKCEDDLCVACDLEQDAACVCPVVEECASNEFGTATCEGWKSEGYCEKSSVYYAFMMRKCATTCCPEVNLPARCLTKKRRKPQEKKSDVENPLLMAVI